MASGIRQAGVTLIELMIGLTLGLFLTAGILYLYLGSRTSYSTQSGVSNVQESLRFGFEYLAFDIRMAGYTGCANVREMTPLVEADPPPPGPALGLGTSLVGYDNGSGWTNPTAAPNRVERVDGTDVISMSRVSMSGIHLVENSDGSEFHIGSNPFNFAAGQVLVVTDCRRSDIFRATSISSSSGKINVAHGSSTNTQPAGSACAPGSGKLATECGTAGNYKTDAQLAAIESWAYFIGINGNGRPSLYRVAAGSAAAEELVEGIYDMQFQYGLDTTDDTTFVADSYSATPTNWAQVVSVRMTLSARTPDDGVLPATRTYTYNGASVSDRRFRQSQTTVVGLRNLVQ